MFEKDPFQRYLDLADVLGTMFAPFVEVIVHDLRTPESSIIAIYRHLAGDNHTQYLQTVRGQNKNIRDFRHTTGSGPTEKRSNKRTPT